MKKIELSENLEELDDVFASSSDLRDYDGGIDVGCSGVGSASCKEGCKDGSKEGNPCQSSCYQGCSEGCKEACKPGKK